MFDNRRGITPLVATVLLVAFSVGLGALVMSWGEDYIEQKAEFVQGTGEVKSACDSVSLDLIKVGGRAQACMNSKGIELWIDNGPDADLSNIQARIAGSRGIDVQPDVLLSPLVKSNSVRIVVPVKSEVGKVLQLKLTPKVWSGTKESVCATAAVTVEEFGTCAS